MATQEQRDQAREAATDEFLAGTESSRRARREQADKTFSTPYTAGARFLGDKDIARVGGGLAREVSRMTNQILRDPYDPHHKQVRATLDKSGVIDNAEGPTGTCFFRESSTGQEIALEIERDREGRWFTHYNGRKHVSDSRDALLSAISREINNNSKQLTQEDLREVSIVCNAKGFYAGVAAYASKVTGTPIAEVLSDDFILDSRNAKLLNSAVSFCFLACNGSFSPGEDWDQFLAVYARGRAYSGALCEGAMREYLKQRDDAARQALLSVPEAAEPELTPEEFNFDTMDDAALAAQFQSVASDRAKRLRARI